MFGCILHVMGWVIHATFDKPTCDHGDRRPGHRLEDGGAVGVELSRDAAQLLHDVLRVRFEEQRVEAGVVVQERQRGVEHLL